LNRLAGADIYAENQLFATLDPTTRQVELPNGEPCLMTDTVGFIRKLPHHLVDSFKATLEEVVEADLILHVIDCSHPQVEQQILAVNTVLQEIGAENKPVLCVLNKIDQNAGRNVARQFAHTLGRSASVSALTGEGVESLLNELAVSLKGDKQLMKLAIPMSEGRLLAQLKQSALVLEEKYEGEFAELLVRVPAQLVPRCEPYLAEKS
jgi:GTP-binding protein HflX